MIETFQVLRFLLWMALFPLLTVLVGNGVLLGVAQAREALFALDDVAGTSTLRLALFFVAYLYWALAAWLCARLMYGRRFPHDPTDGWSAAQQELGNRLARWLPRGLGLVATVPLAVAMFRIDKRYGLALSVLAAGFLAFVVWRHRLPLLGDPGRQPKGSHLRYFDHMAPAARTCVATMVGLSWLLFVLLWWKPVEVGRAVGSPALLLVALGGWTLFGSLALSYWPNAHRWPTLNWLPPLALLVFSSFDNHPVAGTRRDADQSATPSTDWRPQRPLLVDHYRRWISAQRAGEPVYFVAVAGGASRAAFWGGMVLGQLEDQARGKSQRFADNIFMISGISGGSLGTAAFVSMLAAQPTGPDLTPKLEAWLGQDFLAPVLGAMLFPDLAQRFLPVFDALHPTDRSLALEKAWSKGWRAAAGSPPQADWWDGPLVAPYGDRTRRLPSMVLNTVRLEDGQRMLQSDLRFALPDAFDLLDDRFDTQHLTLAGAVHNSARFPYISPAGRVSLPADGIHKRAPWGSLGDGGYHEGSGAATLADVIELLMREKLIVSDGPRGLRACSAASPAGEACPHPVVVLMLDNQPEAYGPNWRRGIDGRPLEPDPLRLQAGWPLPEFSAPPLGLLRAWTSHSVRAEWRLARLAGDDPRRYVELRLPACPRQRPPSMNWQLADDSRERMKTAARVGCGGKQPANLADASLRANRGRLVDWIEGRQP